LKRTRAAGETIGWFTSRTPPEGLVIERDPAKVAQCTRVVGGDLWPVHLAAALGLPTVMILSGTEDWLWSPNEAPPRWYPDLELIGAEDSERLAARLAGG